MGLSDLEKQELDILTRHLLDHTDTTEKLLSVIHADMKLVAERLRMLVYLAIAILAARTPEMFEKLISFLGGH